MTTMAHLTCATHTRTELVDIVVRYRDAGIDNILALGGDPPKDLDLPPGELHYAVELVELIRGVGDFSVGVAAHPEPHALAEPGGRSASHRREAARRRLRICSISSGYPMAASSTPPPSLTSAAKISTRSPSIPSTAKPRSQPRKLTTWPDSHLGDFAATTDGSVLTYRRSFGQASIYVSDFDKNRISIGAPRRLTFTDAFDFPIDWTADGRAVIFVSNRTGHWGIFRQSLDQDSAQMLVPGVAGAENYTPKVSPDGNWIVYLEVPGQLWSLSQAKIMRVPVHGGAPEHIFSTRAYNGLRCTDAAANFCAFAEQSADGRELIFTAFDPVKGRGRELTRVPCNPSRHYNWALSLDGKYIAAAQEEQSTINLRGTDGQVLPDITIKDWPGPDNLDFAANSKGLLLNAAPNGLKTLLYVDLSGRARQLWQPQSPRVGYGVPTRDGKRLAIEGETVSSKIWSLKDF